MSSPLRSCEEDEGMVVNSEGGDFDEEDDDGGGGGDLDENASDINSPAAPRETAAAAAPGTVSEDGPADESEARTRTAKTHLVALKLWSDGGMLEVAGTRSLYTTTTPLPLLLHHHHHHPESVLLRVQDGSGETSRDRRGCAHRK